ncbi:enoyl-delta isomerase mitochondrial [Lichtheimia corymbifera JMRC:FSU:9682]|uniref:Enoyl-delta isomerase mitochondrial n=2 Tax=Lichtheimia corymbifera JMRC:FSU:9682 TaxID=1263082 RepID=A0A068RVY4_9FUNG|nr:enoyl-delta isomerase mitochondrial [Lichtheimia corymbifera JMRC:FSU:9682]
MSDAVPQLETIAITLFPSGVAELAFNRPQRYNALSPQAYRDWLSAITWAANDDRVKVTILTGRGKYYTSGQELTMPDFSDENLPAELERRQKTTHDVVQEMIRFPKLLIAAVNGPSIGFGTTTLALCDVVYAAPDATFTTPFMKLGFCAEGCSSVLFPRIMGPSRANEMLLLGRTFTAKEMEDCGFVSRIIPKENFREQILAIAEDASAFSPEAMRVTKDLIRENERKFLEQVNDVEMERLAERMASPDSLKSILKFVESSKKRKKAKLQPAPAQLKIFDQCKQNEDNYLKTCTQSDYACLCKCYNYSVADAKGILLGYMSQR